MSNKDSHDHRHPASYYIKIYWILSALFAVSVIGPLTAGYAGEAAGLVVLITAFGVAIVKALMVAARFMHLNIERKMIWWLMIMTLLAVFCCFAGLAPDVMNPNGANWYSTSEFLSLIHISEPTRPY